MLGLVFFVPHISLLRGPTLDYLVERQGWAWLYAVNIYIAKQGDWSLPTSNTSGRSPLRSTSTFWPLVVFLVARKPRTLIALSLGVALCAVLARLIGLFLGLSYWTTYVLTPFRLDGLALGAFLAVMARQPNGFKRMVQALPRVLAVVGGLLAVTYIWADPSSQWMPLVGTTGRH